MWALIVTLGLSLYMTGVIWGMQILEYPLFARVGAAEFPAYHAQHNRGLPFVVILPSIGAFISAVVLVILHPAAVPQWASILVAVLDLAVIVVTAAREAPLHGKLDREGYQLATIRQLVNGNWARTLLWTATSLVLLVLTGRILVGG